MKGNNQFKKWEKIEKNDRVVIQTDRISQDKKKTEEVEGTIDSVRLKGEKWHR